MDWYRGGDYSLKSHVLVSQRMRQTLHLVFLSTGIRAAMNLLHRSGEHGMGECSNEPCQSKKLINITGAVNLSPSLCLGVKQILHEVLSASLDVF